MSDTGLIPNDIDMEDALLVDVDGYEGPLHLLLDLARRQKVDLREVSILELAQQYLAFVNDAEAMRIDLAAEYLLMAAWLTLLKSRLLLPKPEIVSKGEETGEDLAARLAFRLHRLDKMREAGEALLDLPIMGRDVFSRGMPERSRVQKTIRFHARLIDMMNAFAGIEKRKARVAPHKIEKQYVLPLEVARNSLKAAVQSLDDWASIETIELPLRDDNSEAPPRSRLASVFLAALELTRERDTDLRQDTHFSPLFVRRANETEVAHE